jgi:aminoglycoside phosphotransferase (APT) family kinase protein
MRGGLGTVLTEWLAGAGHRALGESAAPSSVELRRNQSAVLASLIFRQGVRKVAAKQLDSTRSGNSVAELARMHEEARSSSSLLAACTPRFLAHCAEHNFFVMEYIEGPTLLRVLLRQGYRGADDGSVASILIRKSGELLAELHGITPTAFGTAARARKNHTYLGHWRELWKSLGMDRALPAGSRAPYSLLARMSPAFFEREVTRLHPIDFQPKNILVPAADRLCLTDTDYSLANPALAVGQFLASLDRILLRPHWPGLKACVRSWKQAFLAGYASRLPESLNEDVLFFYSWALLRMLKTHVEARPSASFLLKRFYTNRLASFLDNLNQRPDPGETTRLERLMLAFA